MKKITSLDELEVGKVIYLHNTTTNSVVKCKILKISQDTGIFNDLPAITKIDYIDLSDNHKDYFCPRDYNIIPNTYNTYFATFYLER